jgi:glycosyltransferase involved in cell wall biosynthesis
MSERAWPEVSVVIATHDRPQLLAAALDAVLGQDYPGTVECIVVFDQTTPDATLERRAGNRRVTVMTNTRSPGLAGARNAGVLRAAGTYVAFCDDDDEWLPPKLTAQVALLEEGDALTAVTGIVVVYDDHETVRIPSAGDMTSSGLARRRVMEGHPSTVLVRREALLGPIGLVDEDIPGSYGEDFDWILRAAEAGPIAVVEQALVRVRWGQSLFSQRWQTIIDAIDYGIAKHPALRADRQGLARLYGRRAFAQAALGHTGPALRDAARTARLSWRERRAYLAVAVALRLTKAERLMELAHRRGKGI